MIKKPILYVTAALLLISCATARGAKQTSTLPPHNFVVADLSQWTITNTGPTKVQAHVKNGVLMLYWPGGPGQAIIEADGQVAVEPFLQNPPRHPDRHYLRFISLVNILKKQYGAQFDVQLQPIKKNGQKATPYLSRHAAYGGTYGLGANARLYALPGQWAKVDFNYRPSKKINAVRPRFVLRGNAITVAIKKATVAPGLVWKRGRPAAKPEPRQLDPKQVAAILAKRSYAQPQLVGKPGRVALVINNKDIFPACYTRGSHYPRYARYGMFTRAGFNIFRIAASLGPFSHAHRMGVDNLWQGKNKFDFSELAHELKVIANINPEAMVIVSVVMSPYPGWAKQHPKTIVRNAEGQWLVTNGGATGHYGGKLNHRSNREQFYAPTFYAGAYSSATANAIKHLTHFLQTSPVGKIVFEVEFTGGVDGQIFPWAAQNRNTRGANHAPVAVAAWRQFLRERYGNSVGALRAVWHDPKVTFKNAAIPTIHQRGYSWGTIKRRGADYNDFLSYAMANYFLQLGKAAKQGSDGRLLTGVYYSGAGREGIISRMAAWRIMNTPYIDTVRTVHYPLLSGSWLRHDKLIWDELDMRPPMPNPMQYYTRGLNYPVSYFHTLVWRNAAMALTDLGGGYYHYDMAESWYQKQKMINFFGKVRQGLASCVNDQVNIKPVVGVFTDERVAFRLPDHGNYQLMRLSAYGMYQACSHSGVPYARYLFKDALDPSFTLPPICILRVPMAITRQEAATLRLKARQSNSILIWGYGPGVVAHGDPSVQATCGFRAHQSAALRGKQIVVDHAGTLTKGLAGRLMGMSASPLRLRWHESPFVINPESGDVVLGHYAGTNKAGAVLRTRGGLTQIILGRPGAISPQFIRNLAKHVGVTPLSTANDEIYFGSGIMAIYTNCGGERTITLPSNMAVAASPTGNTYRRTPRGFTFNADYNSQAIFKIVKRK